MRQTNNEMVKSNNTRENAKVSIVLTTYNGSKYIVDLLESLRVQTYPVYEVIISDDCSRDNTVEIIRKYIDKYSLNSWKIYVHEKNIGWKQNFQNSLKLATGNYIFLCDQDDIWVKDKIEYMVHEMVQDDEILLLASEFKPFICENIPKYVDDKNNKTYRANWKKDFFYIRRPGCVYCIRKELIHFFDHYSFEDYPHDAFLWRTAAMLNGLYFCSKETVLYRRHELNATGREAKSTQKKLITLEYYNTSLRLLEKFVVDNVRGEKEEKLKQISRYQRCFEMREKLLREHKYRYLIVLLLYLDCYYSPKTYLGDIAFAIGRR